MVFAVRNLIFVEVDILLLIADGLFESHHSKSEAFSVSGVQEFVTTHLATWSAAARKVSRTQAQIISDVAV